VSFELNATSSHAHSWGSPYRQQCSSSAEAHKRRRITTPVGLLTLVRARRLEVLFACNLGRVVRDDGPPTSTTWVVTGVKR